MKLKAIFCIGILMALTGAVFSKIAFDKWEGKPPTDWYMPVMFIGEALALVTGLMLHYKRVK